MATKRASSSSSFDIRSKYDVFLSFRGKDTRNNFTSHLHHALVDKGIYTFMDDKELQRGEAISPTILHAVEESKISIIVLSRNYASSKSCLDELVKILECKASKGQMVLPIFYNVDPSEVRNFEKGRFADAMARHKEKFTNDLERFQKWMAALREVSKLSGWDLRNVYESKFIQKIVQDILCKLKRTTLNVAKHPVGLGSLVQDMLFLLSTELDDVRMVGICGIGGIGKTTLAKAIYNTILDQFEGSSFIANVREFSGRKNGLVQLQRRLLSEILSQKKFEVSNIHQGVNLLRERLCHKKVLIVLDDVDQLEQLENLAGDCSWFGPGSRIMITTRDEHVLVAHEVEHVYKVKELNKDNSLELFSLNAFKKPFPLKEYEELTLQVINYAKGLPLALIVLGSLLCGRNIPEWKSTLNKLKMIPNKQIYDTLKISYDELEDNEKEIFLDIAFFFKGEDKDYVARIFDSCNFYSDSGISILTDKSLITVDSNEISMHDLLQEMGWEIVRQESLRDPGKRSRLWFHEDVLRVLTENAGTETIEGIKLDFPEPEEVVLEPDAFTKMKKLRLLIVRNANISGSHLDFLSNELRLLDWPRYPFSSLPCSFGPNNLVEMNLSNSLIERFMMGFKMYRSLKSINLSFCEALEEIPDFSIIPNLESLVLDHCTRLKEIHTSVGYLQELVTLSLIQCYKLKSLPDLKLKSLQHFSLAGCSELENFPNIVEKMENLEELYLEGTALKHLPLSIENLVGLKMLYLDSCENLEVLPSNLHKLQHLVALSLSGCSKLQNIPELPPNLLSLSAAGCKSLESILDQFNGSKRTRLSYLNLINCEKLAKYQVENIANKLTSEGLVTGEIRIPGSKIPDWFNHHDTKGRISFEVSSSLYAKPLLWSFYVVFGVEEGAVSTSNFACTIEIVINNETRLMEAIVFQSVESDHVWLTSFFPGSLRWPLKKMLWTRFDVSITIEGVPKEAQTRAILKKCGFHLAYNRDGHITIPTIIRKPI